MRWIPIVVCSAVLAGSAASAAAQALAAPAKIALPGNATSKPAAKEAVTSVMLPPSPRALLPDALDGWVETEPPKALADPALADAANAAALKEYDYTGGAQVTYKREGETLSVRALRFQDASGAYGAYSFYRQNGWAKEDIGTGATSNHNRVLFWKGDTVVDATFSHIGPMSAGEMRELASHVPNPPGTKAMMPPILADLPQGSLDGQTTHYAEGPAGYAGAGGVLPPELVGFDRGAEAVTANYSLNSGSATLTIIDYPTPQMAEAQEPRIRAYIQAGSKAQPAWPKPLVDSDLASLEVRRSGPLVVLVSGDAIPDESHKLLEMVHFEADLTKIPQPMDSEVKKTAQLLMGIAAIVIVGGSAALLLGFFLGGGRALYRIARGKPASSVFDEEFIRIDLREEWDERLRPMKGPHPKG
ncbi:MAG TPA: DUF6599 family protein [Terracidiphilus sp.]|nr:DUF6599 family protein [Terracidiphilus sp.]